MIWKEMDKYPNYMISEKGDIKNKRTNKLLKQQTNKKGYHRVDLSYKKGLLVHRLVYDNFVGNLDKDKVIDHIDGNVDNNHYSNLQQITISENTQRGLKCKHIIVKLNDDYIYFNSLSDLCRFVGVSTSYTIKTIQRNKLFKQMNLKIMDVYKGGDISHA